MYPDTIEVSGKKIGVDYDTARGMNSTVRIRDGRVVMRLSRYVSRRQKIELVDKFLAWATKKLENYSASDFVNPVYVDGASLCTHNKAYDLVVKYEIRKNSRASLKDENLIEIVLSESLSIQELSKKIRHLSEKVIMKDQKNYLEEVISELNQLHFQEDYNAVRFKRTKSRFGSCSSKRNLNIAYRLLFSPRNVFRYVCVHELAHLKEFNHSRRFWALVEEAMPNYKECEKWLRQNGFMLG